MNARRWGGILCLVVAMALLGYSQVNMRRAAVARAQWEQVWGGGEMECVGSRYDCPDPKYDKCVPVGSTTCYRCTFVQIWTGCVAYKDDSKSCTVTGTGVWCGRLYEATQNKDGTCNPCLTPTMNNCGVQSGATGDGCKIGP